MKIELGDNATDAIRFLLLGLGVLLLLRLGYAGLELLFAPPVTTDIAVAIDSFRNGYLLADRSTLVVGGRDLTERLALAVVMGAACATIVAVPAALLAPLFSMNGGRAAIVAGRTVLFAACAWWLYAALALPPITVRVSADEFVRTERSALFQDLSIPFTATETRMIRTAGASIQQRSATSHWSPCEVVEEVFTQYGSEQMVIARVVPSGADCAASENEARRRAKELSTLLQVDQAR